MACFSLGFRASRFLGFSVTVPVFFREELLWGGYGARGERIGEIVWGSEFRI